MNGNPESMNVEEVMENNTAVQESSVGKQAGMEDIIAQANAEFDRELQVNLDKEKLTYICDYCGKVNSMKAPRCVRCGKRRPRSEFIKAMSNIRAAEEAKQEYAIEKAVEAEEYREAERAIIEQKDQIVEDRRKARNMEVVRLVEERVADEMQSLKAQEEVRIDQERELAKKMAAREAVVRIIAAEKAAEDIVEQNKKEVAEREVAIQRNLDQIVADERERAINAAAEQLVAQRAGIEQAAAEQIEYIKTEKERETAEQIAAAKDEASRVAARQAVLRIIAKERAADDEIEQSKDAIARAARQRIEEDRVLIEKEANARILAEKQGIERAADERIRAEREIIKKLLEERKRYNGGDMGGMPVPSVSQGNQYIQPMVIVPYVNSQQPLLQYKPNQVYRFVPNTYTEQQEIAARANQNRGIYTEGPVPTQEEISALTEKKEAQKAELENEIQNLKSFDDGTYSKTKKGKKARASSSSSSGKTRAFAALSAIAVLGIALLLAFLPLVSKSIININSAGASNFSLFEAFAILIRDGINDIFNANLAFLGNDNQYVNYLSSADAPIGILLPLGLVFACLCYVVLLVRCICRIVTGRTRGVGAILPSLALVFVICAVVGALFLDTANMADALKDTSYSAIILAAAAILALIFFCLSGSRSKKKLG